MVVFTCNHCGESLQKPKVEKHYSFVCRREKNLTCVDCFQDFRAEEYVVHTKCFTEEERYAAKGSHPTGIIKKGDVKQESWLAQVRSIIDQEKNLRPSVRNLLNTISEYNNIPRKRQKFINFLTNSLGRVSMKDVETAWDIIEKHKNDSKVNTESHNADKCVVNGTTETNKQELNDPAIVDNEDRNINETENNLQEKVERKKKRKKNEDKENGDFEVPGSKITKTTFNDIHNESEIHSEVEKFNIKKTVVLVLEKKGSISLKKLEKKVVSAYKKTNSCSGDLENVLKKFYKKLKKMPVQIVDNQVSLVAE